MIGGNCWTAVKGRRPILNKCSGFGSVGTNTIMRYTYHEPIPKIQNIKRDWNF